MKKIISALIAVSMILSISVVSVFAATVPTSTFTLSVSDDVTSVKAGDVIEAKILLNTTRYTASYKAAIEYDADVFELASSNTYAEFAADPQNIADAALEEMTIDEYFLAANEIPGGIYVGDAYIDCWSTNSGKKYGIMDVVATEGVVSFGGASSAQITMASKSVTDAVVASIMLRVKDDVSVDSTDIKIGETYTANLEERGTITFANEKVTLAVEGSGPVGPTVEEVEPETAAGITAYTVSTLAEKVIMTKTFQNVAVKPGMGLVVTNNGVTREFGGDLYEVLGSPAEGTVTIGSLTFGLVVEDTASASQFTFELR